MLTKLGESNIIRTMKLSSKKEDYLETIYRLSQEIDAVGISDIARERGVTLPTVKSAVTKLKEKGLLTQRYYGKVVLTEAGEEKAAQIYESHKTLRKFLNEILGLSPEISEEDACQMEHGLSPETFRRLERFVRMVLECRESEETCRSKYDELLKH